MGMMGEETRSGTEIKPDGILCDSRSGLSNSIKYEQSSRSLVDSYVSFLIRLKLSF
jgi:hypothetical protein